MARAQVRVGWGLRKAGRIQPLEVKRTECQVVRRDDGKWGGEQVISWASETRVHKSDQGCCLGERQEVL